MSVESTSSWILRGPIGSWLIALIVFFVSLPLTAIVPLSGDATELVLTAQNGGVPHAPGFPVQAWLDRWFLLLPVTSDATKLALLSLCAHAGAAACIAEAGRALAIALPARVAAALSFALFPTTWQLGVQPEVFALAHLAIAVVVLLAAAAIDRAPSLLRALIAGVAFGVGVAQHPIVVVAAPAFFVAAGAFHRPRAMRLVAVAVAVSLACWCSLYATVPLLRGESHWPDWGDVDDVGDIVRLALRRDFGVAQLTPTDGETLSALVAFLREVVRSAVAPALLAIGGAVALVRARRLSVLVAVAGVAALGGLLLLRARFGGGDVVATAFLERFFGVVVVPAALLVGLGVDAVERAAGRRGWLLSLALVVVVVAASFFGSYERANLADRREMAILRVALGASLSSEAVWLAGADDEVFGGALAQNSDTGASLALVNRWPVAAGLLGLDWYRQDVLPHLEPRLAWSDPSLSTVRGVVQAALAQRRAVVSTDRALVEATGAPARLDGLLWIADGRDGDELTWRTVEGAALLCVFLEELSPMPDDAPAFGRSIWFLAGRAFDGAAQYLARVEPSASEHAVAVAQALARRAVEPATLEHCELLRAAVARLRPDLRKSNIDDPTRMVVP